MIKRYQLTINDLTTNFNRVKEHFIACMLREGIVNAETADRMQDYIVVMVEPAMLGEVGAEVYCGDDSTSRFLIVRVCDVPVQERAEEFDPLLKAHRQLRLVRPDGEDKRPEQDTKSVCNGNASTSGAINQEAATTSSGRREPQRTLSDEKPLSQEPNSTPEVVKPTQESSPEQLNLNPLPLQKSESSCDTPFLEPNTEPNNEADKLS
jgi:hypothetical protein